MNSIETNTEQKNVFFYFMRHAQSLANIGQNTLNSPLSPEGILQASKLVGNVDIVILSGLKRTRQTLEYSNIVYNNTMVVPLCNEIKSGSISDVIENDTELEETYFSALSRKTNFKIFLKNLALTMLEKDKDVNILIISHSEFIRFLLDMDRYLYNCEFVVKNSKNL